MNHTPTDAEKTSRLPWIVATDASNSVFAYLTFFGSPFLLMLSSLGLPKTSIGLLMSLLPFFGLTSLVSAPYIARYGFKRTWLVFFGARKLVTALLLLTPWVAQTWGGRGAFVFVAVVMALFSLCRALAETAAYPWSQEMIPDGVRGKFTALDYMVLSTAAALALVFAGWVLGDSPPLSRFMTLILVGLGFGFFAVWCSTHWVGGAPLQEGPARPSLNTLLGPLRDRNFAYYLGVHAAIALASGMGTFLPLYLKDAIGLPDSVVVWLQISGLAASLVTAYAWGWAADRFGARPVVLVSTYLMPLTNILWFMLPRHSSWSAAGAAGLYFIGTAFGTGWAMGTTRMVFSNIVPQERRTEYMSVYYAWIGLMGGITPLLAGWVLDQLKELSGQWGPFVVDQYTPLWASAVVLVLVAAALVSRIRTGETPVGKFAGMFFQGNPLLAVEAILRHSMAREEQTREKAAEMMGRVRSPLYIEELVEALEDPSYRVRHEAIMSIAHMPPEPRLVEVLQGVLLGKHPDLAVSAAWALGRMGALALEPLREGLRSPYPMVAAASARALGQLGDRESQGELLAAFRTLAPESPLRMAYAAALGALRCREAAGDLLVYLSIQEGPAEEVALALARIVGGERRFIRLWRQTHTDLEAGAAQAIGAWRGKVKRLKTQRPELQEEVEAAYQDYLAGQEEAGKKHVVALLRELAGEPLPEPVARIMRECAVMLEQDRGPQRECLLLSLHAIGVALSYLLGERSRPEPAPEG